MSVEDLEKGLRAIDDEDVRAKVAAGDVSAAGDLDLTDEEQALLRGAADDYPDVVGFTFEMFEITKPASLKVVSKTGGGWDLAYNTVKQKVSEHPWE